MDNFFEFEQAGRDKHQRFMQQASDRRRARKSMVVVRGTATTVARRLQPIWAALANLLIGH